ncbi:hypothetical protein F5B20DRAFT_104762 [Whalleya microplaca]|nr:hypothetical protein F5B20DRAFT_104762 [Whalleya microplaca]
MCKIFYHLCERCFHGFPWATAPCEDFHPHLADCPRGTKFSLHYVPEDQCSLYPIHKPNPYIGYESDGESENGNMVESWHDYNTKMEEPILQHSANRATHEEADTYHVSLLKRRSTRSTGSLTPVAQDPDSAHAERPWANRKPLLPQYSPLPAVDDNGDSLDQADGHSRQQFPPNHHDPLSTWIDYQAHWWWLQYPLTYFLTSYYYHNMHHQPQLHTRSYEAVEPTAPSMGAIPRQPDSVETQPINADQGLPRKYILNPKASTFSPSPGNGNPEVLGLSAAQETGTWSHRRERSALFRASREAGFASI